MGIAALVCLFLVILAQIQADEAKKQEAIAVVEKENAVKAQEEAEVQRGKAEQSAKDANEQKLLAQAAEKDAVDQKNIADEQKRAAEAATLAADAARKEAEISEGRAVQSAEVAEAERQKADVARLQAEDARKNAEALRYQAIAQSMAIKTGQVKDTTRKTLIAMQAFNFYREYSDKPYNADIYQGLYNAWKAEEGEDVVKWPGHTGGVRSVVYSKGGERMYSAGADGRVLRWDVSGDKRQGVDVLASPNASVNRVVAVSPDEKYVAVGNERNIQLIDLSDPASPNLLDGHDGIVFDLVFLPDGSGFISVGIDGSIKRSNYATFTPIGNPGGRVEKLAISADGKTLAAGGVDGNVYLYDLRNNNLQSTLAVKTEKAVTAVAFSANGQYLAFGDLAGKITIQDIVAKATYAELNGHESRVADLRFNGLSTLLASAGWDGTAKLWVVKDIFDLPTILNDHQDYVNAVSFSPDGHHLATASFDNLVRVWPTKPDMIAEQLCQDVNRNLTQVEWDQYVGRDIEYEITCPDYPSGAEQL